MILIRIMGVLEKENIWNSKLAGCSVLQSGCKLQGLKGMYTWIAVFQRFEGGEQLIQTDTDIYIYIC